MNSDAAPRYVIKGTVLHQLLRIGAAAAAAVAVAARLMLLQSPPCLAVVEALRDQQLQTCPGRTLL